MNHFSIQQVCCFQLPAALVTTVLSLELPAAKINFIPKNDPPLVGFVFGTMGWFTWVNSRVVCSFYVGVTAYSEYNASQVNSFGEPSCRKPQRQRVLQVTL